MSYIGSQSRMIFGAGGEPVSMASAGANHQLIPELITATTSRVFKGEQTGAGLYSLHVIVGAGTAPVGSLTVWYSNLPNPDPTNDAHWVQDAGIAAIDLSVATGTFKNITGVTAENIRVKAARTSGTISLIVWVKSPSTT